MPSAVALISGGLDSILAAYLVKRQNVQLHGIHFLSIFSGYKPKAGIRFPPRRLAESIGVPLQVENFSKKLLSLVKSPDHGYGSRLNPCIDCKIAMLSRAREYMAELGASYLVTGEVVGQRPMSQRTQILKHIERHAGLESLILRPLSAKCLPPTIPEEKGWIDREQLLGLIGRGRRRQIRLARDVLSINDLPTPTGGCLLTDPGFSIRLDDLLAEDDPPTLHDIQLLKSGRHFRLDDETKAVVGRNEADNARILTHARPDDLIIELEDVTGPTTLLRGNATPENVQTAAALTAAYSNKVPGGQPARVRLFYPHRREEKTVISVTPAPQEIIDELILAPMKI